MSDSWDDMRKAKEEAFFKKQNDEAVQRLKARENEEPRLSPISGKPMEQVTYMGVVIDRCKESGGVWLDKGELDEIMRTIKDQNGESKKEGWIDSFFDYLSKK